MRWIALALLAGSLLSAHAAGEEQPAAVDLYFFWSQRCPHCLDAQPFVAELPRRHPWLRVHVLEVSGNRENAQRYIGMAAQLGQEAEAVPAFLFCGEMHVGYDTPTTTGVFLEARLEQCHARGGLAVPPTTTPAAPLPGGFDVGAWSLPLVTLVLAGLDAFNPCAFFVLLFLLSLMVHARSRARMLAVGGVFVLISGLVYFAFMAAWLNLFLLAGELRIITVAAGALAVAMALANIKDYFWFKRGPSLSIPESAKPGLFARMRTLLGASNLASMLAGTAVLAISANTYELLCTAGFPMVFTRILTLRELPAATYYGYLALYNLIYVLPLGVIVGVFAWTLGSRKLTEEGGRRLKLLSGLMMLGLGTMLLAAPQWLDHPVTAVALVAAALVLTWIAGRWWRRSPAAT